MNMRIETIAAELEAKMRQLENGRLNFTMEIHENGCRWFYVTHWFRPHACSFEDIRSVAYGTLGEVLDGLEHYVETYSPHGPRAMEPGDIGMVPVKPMPAAAE